MSSSDTMNRNTSAGQESASGKSDARRAVADSGDHLRKAASSATDAADLTYDELLEQMETLKSDLTGLVEVARSAGVKTARKAYAGAQRAGRKAAAAAEDGYELAGERFGDAYSVTEDFVRERPAVSLGLAAGAGFLLAMFLSRR